MGKQARTELMSCVASNFKALRVEGGDRVHDRGGALLVSRNES